MVQWQCQVDISERCCSLLQPSPHPLSLHSSEGQREHLSFRQGPSKRFFETAEGLEQGERRCSSALSHTGASAVECWCSGAYVRCIQTVESWSMPSPV